MSDRLERATTLASRIGLYAAGMGLLNLLLRGGGLTAARFALFLLVVPAASFVLFFGLVFALAFTFPPTSDEISGRLSFPGAGWVIWPLICLLIAGTVYLVVSR